MLMRVISCKNDHFSIANGSQSYRKCDFKEREKEKEKKEPKKRRKKKAKEQSVFYHQNVSWNRKL